MVVSPTRRLWSAMLAGAVAAVAVLALASPGGAGETLKHCGSKHGPGAGWSHVRALHIRCHHARRVANHYWRTGDHSFNGFECHQRQIGDEVWHARCDRDFHGRHQQVRFQFGA